MQQVFLVSGAMVAACASVGHTMPSVIDFEAGVLPDGVLNTSILVPWEIAPTGGSPGHYLRQGSTDGTGSGLHRVLVASSVTGDDFAGAGLDTLDFNVRLERGTLRSIDLLFASAQGTHAFLRYDVNGNSTNGGVPLVLDDSVWSTVSAVWDNTWSSAEASANGWTILPPDDDGRGAPIDFSEIVTGLDYFLIDLRSDLEGGEHVSGFDTILLTPAPGGFGLLLVGGVALGCRRRSA